ncbi:MAG: dephospho-CoA kinase [Spirulinaceae cyanobacterium SM2_1_0]|nr:dephospho-CoA kinase [Spirulinaceae cyanobacterium SM2_1_0]
MSDSQPVLGPLRRIGLTGGIATGKSTVSDYLAQCYQWPVLDADRYAREAVAPGSAVLATIVERYGVSLLQTDGQLNRRLLGDRIFNQPRERHWLETQIFPVVRACFQRDLVALKPPTAVLAIPLLFEAEMTDLVTEIWVVACTPAQQLARLQARDQLPAAQARARIASQLPLATKIAAADVVLDNTGDRAHLLTQVDAATQFARTPDVNLG